MNGRKCIKCTSRINNEKLKAKNYYKQYYIDHADKMKENDKKRYQRQKNLVQFTFENAADEPPPCGSVALEV
jgi:hypothetical protein